MICPEQVPSSFQPLLFASLTPTGVSVFSTSLTPLKQGKGEH